jgi:hypothetical protein
MKFNEENLTIDLSDYCENVLMNNETYQSVIDLLTWRIEGIDFLYHNHNHYWSDEWIDGLSEYAEEVGADFISDIVVDYMEDLIKELNIFDTTDCCGRKYNCEEKYWIKENYEEYTEFFNEKLKQFKIIKELRKKPIVEIQEPKGEINKDNIIKITGEKSEMVKALLYKHKVRKTLLRIQEGKYVKRRYSYDDIFE